MCLYVLAHYTDKPDENGQPVRDGGRLVVWAECIYPTLAPRASSIKRSVHGDDAAICQMTVITCYIVSLTLLSPSSNDFLLFQMRHMM